MKEILIQCQGQGATYVIHRSVLLYVRLSNEQQRRDGCYIKIS